MSQDATSPVKCEPETISLLYDSEDNNSNSSPVVIDLTYSPASSTAKETGSDDDASHESSTNSKNDENNVSAATTTEQQHDDQQEDMDDGKGGKYPGLTSTTTTTTPSTIATAAASTGGTTSTSASAIASSNMKKSSSKELDDPQQQDALSTAQASLKQPPLFPAQQLEEEASAGNNKRKKNTPAMMTSLKMRQTTLFWKQSEDSDDEQENEDEVSSSVSPQDSSVPVVSTEDDSQKSATSTEGDDAAAVATSKAAPPHESSTTDDTSKQSASLFKTPPGKDSMDGGEAEEEEEMPVSDFYVGSDVEGSGHDHDSSFEMEDPVSPRVNSENAKSAMKQQRSGTKRKAAMRCQNCAGCREPVCGKCSYEACSSCCFRPCVNYAYITLRNREVMARNMANRMPDTYKQKFDRVYGDPAIALAFKNSEEAYKNPTCKKRKLQEESEPNDEASTATPQTLQTIPSPPSTPRRQPFARCNECIGCFQLRCGHCSSCVDQPVSVDGCVFRPCIRQGVACLDTLRMAARTVAGLIPELLEETYNTVYGPDGVICSKIGNHVPISPKRPAAAGLPSPPGGGTERCNSCFGCLRRKCYRCDFCLTRKFDSCAFRPCVQYRASTLEQRRSIARQLALSLPDNYSALFESLYGPNGLVGERISHDEPEAVSSSPVARLTEPVTEFLGRRCGTCTSCLEVKCGNCEPCNQSGGPYTACIYTLCPSFGYAERTRRYYCKVAEEITPCCGKKNLHESMYGVNGWVRAGAGKAKEVTAPEAAKRCMSCESCLKSRCGTCAMCTGNSKSYTTCLLRLCRNFCYARSTLQVYDRSAAKWIPPDEESAALHESMYGPKGWVTLKLQKKPSTLSIGTRVYCLWPDNKAWYWGHIQGCRLHGEKRFYKVVFDDGDERTDVRWDEFVTENEYQPPLPAAEDRKRPTSLTQRVGASSSDLKVGSRCYAKYSNGQWYWGTVSKISGNGRARTFSVQFDDGDYLAGLAAYCIISEEQHKQEFGDSNSSRDEKKCRTPSELQTYRCKECTFCTKEDCGACQSCVTNKRQTSTCKDMCLMKMCLRIPVEEKQQPLSGLLGGFTYYITDPEMLTASIREKPAVHRDLNGLIISDRNGTMFRTLKDACKFVDISSQAVHEAEMNLYQQVLGKTMTEQVVNHQILGKGFHRQWQDCKGDVKEVYGTITECKKNLLDGSLQFTVELFEECRKPLKAVALLQQGVPEKLEGISAADAWGGFVSFMKLDTREGELALMKVPPYHTYIVPGSRHVVRYTRDGIPVIVYHVKNHRLEIEARQSDIPNAGLGLWVKCTCIIPMSKKRVFDLPKGHLIDLGVYAPLTAGDCRNENIALLKNFLFSWNCEGWYWDSAEPSIGSVYDITDDLTGNLHETARKTPIVYANETDGHSQATILSSNDPEGSVHYYLGSVDSPVRLPTNGTPVELKIDYGPRYERVRVRKGYPRVTGRELEIKRQKIEHDDHDTIREFHECSVTEILEAVDFLKPIFAGFLASDNEKIKLMERALVAALAMSGRLNEIRKEFENFDDNDDSSSVCTNGYSTLEEDEVENKLSSLIAHLCSLFPCGSNQLHAQLLADGMYQMVLIQSLGLETIDELRSLSPVELRRRIECVLAVDK